MIDPRNTASVHVAERLGFTVRNREERMGKEMDIYQLLRLAGPDAQET